MANRPTKPAFGDRASAPSGPSRARGGGAARRIHHWRLVSAALPLAAFLGALPAAALELPPDLRPIPLGRAASAAPVIAFSESEVFIAQLVPQAPVVVFSVGREPRGYYSRVQRHAAMGLADLTGAARFAPAEGVTTKSVWAVVDVVTGLFTVAAPEPFEPRELDLPGRAFEVGAPGQIERLRHLFNPVAMLLVRPAVGAWTLRAVDGGEEDADGTVDGALITSLDALVPIDPSPPPPERFAAGDVVVLIHPDSLQYVAIRLLGPPPEAGGGG